MIQPPMISHQQFTSSPPSMHHLPNHMPYFSPSSSASSSLCSPAGICRERRGSSSGIETGVWTSTEIPVDVTFGPFEGEFTLGKGMKDHRDSPYMLEVKFIDGRLISGPDAHQTRWMIFVSPARYDHNLVADWSYDQPSQIVFRTSRPISKGEEILVWYSSRLAEKTGVATSVDRFKGKDGRFTCGRCCSNFAYPNTLKAHMRFECYTQEERLPAAFVDVRPAVANGDHGSLSHASAFHRFTPSSPQLPQRLYGENNCQIIPGSPQTSSKLGRMDEQRRDNIGSGSNGAASPSGILRTLFSGKIGSNSGSAFRPIGKFASSSFNKTEENSEEKFGFRVIRKDSKTMGTSMGTPISPAIMQMDSHKRVKTENETDETHKDSSRSDFSMDKVLSLPRVGHPSSPGAALAYLQVQKALEKNYGLPTYDPVMSQAAGDIPAAMRALHRGPLGIDPYTGYPYRFFPPPGFPITRLPHVLPMHARQGEPFNGLGHKFQYPGFLKFPPSSSGESSTSPPSALLTPPPEMDFNKYAALERNLTNNAARAPFPLGDPQFAYSQNGSDKNKKGHLCIYCGKLYSRKYGLKIHLRTHTGYKPLKCKVCFRPFGDPSNLNKHIRLHAEGDTPYRCEYCGKVLVRRRDLDRHIRSRHPAECERKHAQLAAADAAKEQETIEHVEIVHAPEQEEPEDLSINVVSDDDEDDVECVEENVSMEEDMRQS